MANTGSTVRSQLPVVPNPREFGQSIDYERFMDCIHCGLCLGSCPTYTETGNENDSPRGRIYLWRAVTDGRAELTPDVKHHLDLCLECLACETACPSGVQYNKIISSYKHDMAKREPAAAHLSWLQRSMLFNLTPYASRMRWALAPVRLMQRIGLGSLVRWSGKVLPSGLRRMQEIVPTLEPHYGRLPEILPAEGKRRARVALFLGCAADAFYPQTTLATARVLQKNGCEVWIPRGQGCCGALHVHSGLEEKGQAFAAQNCEVFGKQLDSVDAIVNSVGGCGPVLKDYDHLLQNTPSAELGAKIAPKMKDITEFLMGLGLVPPQHPVPLRATYHDACGMSHGQKIRQMPRQMLAAIPGLQLVPLADSETCCGAAGSYNLTQPEMAAQIGKRKAQNILDTGAQAVFTGNVGCLLQITRHLRDDRPNLWVAHPVEALWASYTGVLSPAAQKAQQSPTSSKT